MSEQFTECDTFTFYLCALTADEYIRRKYAEAQMLFTADQAEPIDRVLLEAGRRGGLHLGSADAYARLFRPRTALRQKLIVLLAILENAPATHRYLNSAASGGVVVGLFRIARLLAGTMMVFALGLLRFGPRHLLAGRVAPVHVQATDPS